jgi:hypothetical protein
VGAYTFGLDLVYVHMDLNDNVGSVLSVPSPFLIQRTDPLYGNVLPLAQIFCAILRRCARDYNETTPYWDWTIGNVTALARLGVTHHPSWLKSFRIDVHYIYKSRLFDNSSSGLGGCGDPNNDYQIYTGGFKDEIRAYPSPSSRQEELLALPVL